MRTCVVHAHPVPESYSSAVFDATLDALRLDSIEPDIYRLGQGDSPGPTVAELEGIEALFFVHPTWWGSQPAVLLEWIQATLGPWIDGPASGPSPLADVRSLTAITTHGSSALINRIQGEPGRQLLTRVIAPLCRSDVDTRWLPLYKMDRTTEQDRAAFLDQIRSDARLVAG